MTGADTVEKQEQARAATQALLNLFDSVRDRIGDVSIDEVRTLLCIAATPGEPQTSYISKLDIPRSTVQRYIGILGDKGFRTRPALCLIEGRRSPENWRETEYRLTVKGRAVLQDMKRHLER